jgi:hypothetical protein
MPDGRSTERSRHHSNPSPERVWKQGHILCRTQNLSIDIVGCDQSVWIGASNAEFTNRIGVKSYGIERDGWQARAYRTDLRKAAALGVPEKHEVSASLRCDKGGQASCLSVLLSRYPQGLRVTLEITQVVGSSVGQEKSVAVLKQ